MSKINEQALREQRQQSVKIAELKATDVEDMEMCVNDLQKFASLNQDAAFAVASAFRNKTLPSIAREAGLNEEIVSKLTGAEPMMTNDFANEQKMKNLAPDVQSFAKAEDKDDDLNNDLSDTKPNNDLDEDVDDSTSPVSNDDTDENIDPSEDNLVTVEIQLSSDKLDLLKQVLDQVLGDSDTNTEEDKSMVPVDDSSVGDDNHDELNKLDDLGDDAVAPPITASRKVKTIMSNERAAAQKKRNAIMASLGNRVANQEDDGKTRNIGLGDDTSHNGKPFQYAPAAQFKGEDTYNSLTLNGSEGNSLRDQNPSYAALDIPTLNGKENYQLNNTYTFTKKEGTPEDPSFYQADFNAMLPIPSENAAELKDTWEAPSQKPDEYLKRKTTVAQNNICDGCDNSDNRQVVAALCTACNNKLNICSWCEDKGHCPYCAGNSRVASDETSEDVTSNGETPETTKRKNQFDGSEMTEEHRDKKTPFDQTKEAKVFKARISTAFGVAYKLACNEIISPDEINDQVQMWMNDHTSPEGMIAQGKLMLRASQNSRDRVIAASANNTRSAATDVGFSISPQMGYTRNENPATVEMHNALSGLFTNPYADYEDK